MKKRVLALSGLILLLPPAIAVAYLDAYTPERWVDQSPTIVVGEVLSVAPAEEREVPQLAHGPHARLRFPHAAARIAISKVLKKEADCQLAAGDTVTLFYATGNQSTFTDETGRQVTLWVEDLKVPALNEGDAGAFSLCTIDGEWRSGCYYHFRGKKDLPGIREALRSSRYRHHQ